jgi:hypothetical protein
MTHDHLNTMQRRNTVAHNGKQPYGLASRDGGTISHRDRFSIRLCVGDRRRRQSRRRGALPGVELGDAI